MPPSNGGAGRKDKSGTLPKSIAFKFSSIGGSPDCPRNSVIEHLYGSGRRQKPKVWRLIECVMQTNQPKRERTMRRVPMTELRIINNKLIVPGSEIVWDSNCAPLTTA